MREEGKNEVGCGKDLEVAFGAPVAFGAVKHAAVGGVVSDFFEGERGAQQVFGETAAANGIVGGDGGLAGIETEAAVAPVLQFGDLPVGEGTGGAQPVEEGVAPELPQLLPAAREGQMEPAVGVEDSGGGDDVDVRVPEEKIAESLESHDKPGLAGGTVGAEAKPGGDGEMSGVVEVIEQRAVPEEERADEPGHREHDVAMGHGCADGVGDEGPLDERAPLVAARAEAALFAGEGEEELVAAVRTMQPRETGVEVAAIEEFLDGGGVLGRYGG